VRALAASSDARIVRGIVGAIALLLGAYCLLVAATALYAAPGQPDPAELAARERVQWPGWIPIVFLALVVLYAVTVAARRRRRPGETPGAFHAGPAPVPSERAGTATPGHTDDSCRALGLRPGPPPRAGALPSAAPAP
jgi:hypothetical protein